MLPPWLERPRGILLGAVAQELLLARTDSVAIALTHIGACSDGFAATLLVMSAMGEEDDEETPFGWGPWRRRADPESTLRIGVRYADGAKAELDPGPGAPPLRGEERPDGPLIHGGGGSGGGGEWRHELWFWPLPPPGPLTFAVQWPARGVQETLYELDAGTILDAAGRAQRLFATGEMSDTPGFSSGPMHFHEAEPD